MEPSLEELREHVVRCYGVAEPDVVVVRAPYRICPLGAHIDHQLGRVTAVTLDRGVDLAFAPSGSREVVLSSLDFAGQVRVLLDDEGPPRPDDWGNYARGAVRAMRQRFALKEGFWGLTSGRVAEGGLSSSAAVSVAYLLALQQVNQLHVGAEDNIQLVHEIENHYLGLRIGILDQSAILLSRAHALTLIDCLDVSHRLIDRPAALPDFAILVAFSGLRKSLAGTDYNRRVEECSAAARALLGAAGHSPEPPKLRRVSPDEYELHGARLAGPPARRARHFFSEMQRVESGVAAWQRGDLQTFGQLVTASGASSIDNYECGAPPLIDLYHILIGTPGVWGARFSGAGFRGCCLALVEPPGAEEIARQVRRVYARRHPDLAGDAWTMLCHPADGAHLIR
jgi:galacturonokinase